MKTEIPRGVYAPGLTGIQIDVIKARQAPVCEHSGYLVHAGRQPVEAALARWVAFARRYASTGTGRHAAFLRGAIARLDEENAASREQGG